jgi:hypothetical protein
MKKILEFYGVSIFAGIVSLFGMVYYLRAYGQYQAPYNTTIVVAVHNECYAITNYCSGNTMMIPTQSYGEWNSVKYSAPGCLARADYGWDYCYYTPPPWDPCASGCSSDGNSDGGGGGGGGGADGGDGGDGG